MGITKDRHGAGMPFFSPEKQLVAGTYFMQFAVISPIEDGQIIYNGVETIDVFSGEVIAVPSSVISLDCSVDFRAAGKFSDIPFSAPKISKQPESVLTAVGTSATLTANTDVNATSLQWFKDGVWVGGETSNTLTIASVSNADEGVYFLRAENARGSIDTTSVRIGVIVETLNVTFETKDFGSTQDGSAIRTGYLDAQHAGAAGDCNPTEFDYDSVTHQIWEISADDDNRIRFTVRDIGALTPSELRLFTPNAGIMATLTRNAGSNGYEGVNQAMADYFKAHNGDTTAMSIGFLA
ncbi:Ig-like domain-containing protein [Vibrio chagasii]|nr:Ig-like domain-containing protein [Vibrio chagasii]CAH6814750.1 Ig-like domain-containing protein [Vibrio chagasii]CAH6819740.1 Ig-like domain-containing protein [Vibrio chagasii]CAH6826945.1 Ig-like domain-containing protein [Vibrio chagasii]CAH6861873.1 Ig-like domain-containing protein [Vibrio chagasii]